MPLKSPIDINDPLPRFTIKANGKAIPDNYPVVSIKVVHEINRISFAEILFVDGEVDTGDFPISNSNDFIPGNTVEIKAGYGDEAQKTIFSGIVVKQKVRALENGSFNLLVSCSHKAVKMTFNRKEAQFSEKTDSDIFKAIIGQYDLTCEVEGTTIKRENAFQKLATDWDYILCRSGFYGFIITPDGDKIRIGKPGFDKEPVLRIAFGESIIAFDAELSAEKQVPSLETTAWDIKSQQLLKSKAREPSLNSQGNLSPNKLGNQLNLSELSLNSLTPMGQDELKTWADSSLLHMRMSAIKGKVSFIGNADVNAGDLIVLEKIGDRFNGKAFVSRVEQDIEEGTWTTFVKFGLEHKPIYEQKDFAYPHALGQLPPVSGLQVGVVKKIFEDPVAQFRILVTIQSNAENQNGIWARLATFYATQNAGTFFLPEIGDEVVIGFMENNPEYPVILGSLYSSQHTPKLKANDDNNYLKAFITKSGLQLHFDDEKKIIQVLTPAGNSIKFDDDAKMVEITDQNSNSIKMSSSGIAITSKKDISINASGNIDISATGKVNVSAKSDVELAGTNINLNAKVGLSAKGNATAELSASGQTTVKGAMVMIN